MERTDAQALRQAGKLFKKAVWGPRNPVKHVRQNYDALLGVHILPNNIDRKEIDVGPIEADLLIPEIAADKRIILYAHGGGFVSGSRFSARSLCASLAHESASRVLVPEYRLAPEHPFPTPLEDIYHAYEYLIRERYPSSRILLAGDGAGANLALALAHNLISRGLPRPAALLLLSPWTDLTCEHAGLSVRKNADPIHTKDMLVGLAHQYTFQSNFTNPQVSPWFADYSNFLPMYIQCGSEEILLDDAKRLASRAESAGNTVVLDIEPGMWHLFQAIDSLSPKAHIAVQRIGHWVRKADF